MEDARKMLFDELCMALIGKNINANDVKDEFYIILDKYEFQQRTTEVALLQEDRNEYLIRKFTIGKTVAGCSERTIEYYGNTLRRQILPRIGKTVDDIQADDIRLYLAKRQRIDKISKVSADNELRIMRSFYKYLSKEGFVQKDPTLNVDSIKCERKRKEAFTDVEVEKIRNYPEDERQRAIVEVLFSTGCRVSELVNIKITDIDGNKILVHGKGAKDRIVYLNARAQVIVEKYISERKDENQYLFAGGYYNKVASREKGQDWWKYPELVSKEGHIDKGTVEQMTRKIAKSLGIERAYPHKFRRTCATMALRRGMPLEQVSKMLGHEEISTTQIYLDLTEEELEICHKKYVV